jgi:hypothetical protein
VLGLEDQTIFQLLLTEKKEDDDDYNIDSRDNENSSEDLVAESEDYDGDEIVDHAVSCMDQYNPFIGQREIHPIRSMHDTAGWALAYYILYEPRVSSDIGGGTLVKGIKLVVKLLVTVNP